LPILSSLAFYDTENEGSYQEGVLRGEAIKILERIGNRRNWIGRPIYQYGKERLRGHHLL